MQGLHQQLGALLSVALPKEESSNSDEEESTRLTALSSLHRGILCPQNALLVVNSSSFLSEGLFQLLSDKFYAIRQLAAISYGSLCAVLCSNVLSTNGHQNEVLTEPVVEQFINWALPVLRDIGGGKGSTDLALGGLREFLSNGDPDRMEQYVLSILKACQELLEDERTSLNLFHQLLGLLSLISLKFYSLFQPHFMDVVDLLLGWALVPDLSESDRATIMDSFFLFQKHWLHNLQFSLNLLSKFLDDMEALLKDTNAGNLQQFGRLLALVSCFFTILQVAASGLLEINLLEQISVPLLNMVPRLLECISMIGKKFGWAKWLNESWRCLTLLAEVLAEKFSHFYLLAFDILFQSLIEKGICASSIQVHAGLRLNLQLLSFQKLDLLPSSVDRVLQFDSPLSQLRLHPNRHVTGVLAATYLFLVQHKNNSVVIQAMESLMIELEFLKFMLQNTSDGENCVDLQMMGRTDGQCAPKICAALAYSKLEFCALMKFDLKVLLGAVCRSNNNSLYMEQMDAVTSCNERLVKLVLFICEKLNPFSYPVQKYADMQVHVLRALQKLSEVKCLRKHVLVDNFSQAGFVAPTSQWQTGDSSLVTCGLRKYSPYIIRSLHTSSPFAVKLVALDWIRSACSSISSLKNDFNLSIHHETDECCIFIGSLLLSVLDAARDSELDVRLHVAFALELLLKERLIDPGSFFAVAEVALDRLGDRVVSVRNAFIKVLAIVLPMTFYSLGVIVDQTVINGYMFWNTSHWKQMFAIKQLPRELQAQHLTLILSYLSQRWKAPLYSWVPRLVFNCHVNEGLVLSSVEKTESLDASALLMSMIGDTAAFEKVCSVHNLAAAWWAIHEAARYCVKVRLRTSLGGPTQTFAALERMLLDVAHLLQMDVEQTEGNTQTGSIGVQLLPMKLLLEFAESLKKNIYNAFDGSLVLPSVTRQSSLFFQANKKVCEEWFHRMCQPFMNAGVALHCYDATVHYCALRLEELHRSVGSSLREKSRTHLSDKVHNLKAQFARDVLQVLRNASVALCRSYQPEALKGLQKWAAMNFSTLFLEEPYVFLSDAGNIGPFSWITSLAYQAMGQYEMAAAHLHHLLQSEESLNSLGSDGVQFAITLIIESYVAVSDWQSLDAWLSELQSLRAKHAGKCYSGALTTTGNEMNAIHAMACFDEGDVKSAWHYLDLTPKSSSELTLDPKLVLQRSDQMLLQALLFHKEGKMEKVFDVIEKAKGMLAEFLPVISLDGFTESAVYATHLHCLFALEEASKIRRGDETEQSLAMSNSLHQILQSPIMVFVQDCSLWLKIFRVYRTTLPSSPVTLNLCHKLIILARKQENFRKAYRLISYLKDHLLVSYGGIDGDKFAISLQYETILLLHAQNKYADALKDLWVLVCPVVVSAATARDFESIQMAKACLKFAKWLKEQYSYGKMDNVFLEICSSFASSIKSEALTSLTSNILSCENDKLSHMNSAIILKAVMGTTIKRSLLCPTFCKSWLAYAFWSYDQAVCSLSSSDIVAQSMHLSPILEPEISSNTFHLTEEETSQLETIIFNLFQKSINNVSCESQEQRTCTGSNKCFGHATSLDALFQKVVCLIQNEGGVPAETINNDPLTSKLTSQLHRLLMSFDDGIEKEILWSSIDKMIDIWWSLRRRRVSLFGHALHGFLQFIRLSSSSGNAGHYGNSQLTIANQKIGNLTLRATLYVLHILLNYGVELKDTLERGLASVPLLPWRELTPQLFARLSSHPEKVIRKLLEGLLLLLARVSPWSIVYSALVDLEACEGEPLEELQHIIGCLTELYPKLIQDVKLLMNELGMLTVLWEEQWLSTLQDLHGDVVRRVNMLKEEAARTAENVTLSHSEKNKINAAKYSAIMAPVIVALERRLASTSRNPETAHETWFQQEYGEQLKSAVSVFRTPPLSSTSLGEVWHPFHAIVSSLTNHQRKSSVKLSDVAPQLAALTSSDIPMPGLEKQISVQGSFDASTDLQGLITISSFSEEVTILSTKTKPKKLVALGSNGQKYAYLLKGREDLRLDARIMQLLQVINSFLYSCANARAHSITVRYYSVTPISGRAGLIQWVDSVISIYSVFKSWQGRVHLAEVSPFSTKMHNAVPPLPRPIDMFYGKLIPALKDKGIRRVISRQDWPHEIKRKVLLDLMSEIPKHLLHQEIWCASEGFKAFGTKLKRFSGSVAAMSMIGHILGLGDRHLDNILIDFCSGDVLHIDYNVCFDKGQRLKIPEIVPFRLTQTIEAALGLTGIAGTFTANCEAVIKVLRSNKDIILMLLDVFVWDPLVEWTRGDNHDDAAIGGEERKGMELAVSLSLFSSRIQEIRIPLQEHRDLLLGTIPAAYVALQKFLDLLKTYEMAWNLFHHSDQERENLLFHETSAKSLVAETTYNAERARTKFEIQAREFALAKALMSELFKEATHWMDKHGKVLDALRSGTLPEVHAPIMLSSTREVLSLTGAILMAGVPLASVPEPMLAHCRDLDREVPRYADDLAAKLSCAMKMLQEYAMALQRFLPLSYVSSSPVHGWAQILQRLIRNISSDGLYLAQNGAAELLVKSQGDAFGSIQKKHEDLCLDVERSVLQIEKIENECSELVNFIGSDSEAKSKDQIIFSFKNYMLSTGYIKRELGWSKDSDNRDHEEMKMILTCSLHLAACAIYNKAKCSVLDILNGPGGKSGQDSHSCSRISFCEFEEHVERCVLVSEFVNDVHRLIAADSSMSDTITDHMEGHLAEKWGNVFQASLHSCGVLIREIIEVALPEIIRSVISYSSDIMDFFGSLSQIRGSIEATLEQLLEVEQERASVVDLEQNYFMKVGLITEQRLALEEAALKGRDHLSWEEAEELVTQEEACRAHLDQLHQTWNQKDTRMSFLTSRKATLKNALASAQRRFSSLSSFEEVEDIHILRSKNVLSALVKPFIELETIDQTLSSCNASHMDESVVDLSTVAASGCSLSESVWNLHLLANNHCFFVWKVFIIDSFLASCLHEILSFLDHNLGFEQLYILLKKKLKYQLQEHVFQYLKERVVPIFLVQLESQNEHLKMLCEPTIESVQAKKYADEAKIVQNMLEKHCDACETARAAKSAASLMKRQAEDLTETLLKTNLEVIQMEWLHDVSLPYLDKNKAMVAKRLGSDEWVHTVLNLNRCTLLENIKSAVSAVVESVEHLQACEDTSVKMEGQLERALGWASRGSNASGSSDMSAKYYGIHSKFHDHLAKRRQLLHSTIEEALGVMKICSSVMEFESSRDGRQWISSGISLGRTSGDGRLWQQAYFNALERLDTSYQSFSRAEKEWELAQKKSEVAASELLSATNELYIASEQADAASGDLQNMIVAVEESASEASKALSAFARVSNCHTALTSECGPMLEEILAITEDLPDIFILGKEAIAIHRTLMEGLAKANIILLPLEMTLTKDTSLSEALAREEECKIEGPSINGQSLYKIHSVKLNEICPSLKPLVQIITSSAKELHTVLSKLAQAATSHAGNLHKAFEGVGGSQAIGSQKMAISRSELGVDSIISEENESQKFDPAFSGPEEHFITDDDWISPPDSVDHNSQGSSITSSETILTGSSYTEPFASGPAYAYDGARSSLAFSITKLENFCVDMSGKMKEHTSAHVSLGSVSDKDMQISVSSSEDRVVKKKVSEGESPHDQSAVFNQDHGQVESKEVTRTCSLKGIGRGKNAHALSVLKRVQMKLDGLDAGSNRQLDISQQVEHLIKQATSIDNLCNMYEGWTPWI